jgi:hypothetical protein
VAPVQRLEREHDRRRVEPRVRLAQRRAARLQVRKQLAAQHRLEQHADGALAAQRAGEAHEPRRPGHVEHRVALAVHVADEAGRLDVSLDHRLERVQRLLLLLARLRLALLLLRRGTLRQRGASAEAHEAHAAEAASAEHGDRVEVGLLDGLLFLGVGDG